MARPVKKGLDYFPLDVVLGGGMEDINCEYGKLGEMVVISLWQRIYRSSYYIEYNEKKLRLYAKEFCGQLETLFGGDGSCGRGIFDAIVQLAAECGIFDRGLLEREGILTSKKIQEIYLEAKKKSKTVAIDEKFRLVEDADCARGAGLEFSGAFSEKTPQSKVKKNKSKVNKSKAEESSKYADGKSEGNTAAEVDTVGSSAVAADNTDSENDTDDDGETEYAADEGYSEGSAEMFLTDLRDSNAEYGDGESEYAADRGYSEGSDKTVSGGQWDNDMDIPWDSGTGTAGMNSADTRSNGTGGDISETDCNDTAEGAAAEETAAGRNTAADSRKTLKSTDAAANGAKTRKSKDGAVNGAKTLESTDAAADSAKTWKSKDGAANGAQTQKSTGTAANVQLESALRAYEKNVGMATDNVKRRVGEYLLRGMEARLIARLAEYSAEQGKRTWQYLEAAILGNFRDGIKTLDAYERNQSARAQRRKRERAAQRLQGGAVMRGINNYIDTNKPDYSNFREEVLDGMDEWYMKNGQRGDLI